MMSPPVVIAITDSARGDLERWLAQLESLLAGAAPGRVLTVLRDRQLPVQARRAFGERLRELTRRYAQPLSVNDRLDLAALLDADAVHLSESSVDVSDARAFARDVAGRAWWVSRASHDPDDAAQDEPDALLLAPVAAPRKGRAALGLAGVQRARRARDRRSVESGACALYALGGVSAGNAAALIRAGADGVALIGALVDDGAPRALIDALSLRRSQ